MKTTIRGQELPPGPWIDEPDRLEFESHGLPCLITRNEVMGYLCGYVAVPPGHPLHGKDYDDTDLQAHGGVNYASACHGKVCHVPKPGEPDDVWWYGFDCSHAFDLQPGMIAMTESLSPPWDEVRRLRAQLEMCIAYRDLSYVKEQCEQLAEQLATRRWLVLPVAD